MPVELSVLAEAELRIRGSQSRRRSKLGVAEEDPSTMTPAKINKALEALFKKRSQLNQAFIDAGRGHEKPSETWRKDDPLALQFKTLHDRISSLESEVTRHMGPGYNEFPSSWTRGKSNKARAGRF